jgi:hypothetical protein
VETTLGEIAVIVGRNPVALSGTAPAVAIRDAALEGVDGEVGPPHPTSPSAAKATAIFTSFIHSFSDAS